MLIFAFGLAVLFSHNSILFRPVDNLTEADIYITGSSKSVIGHSLIQCCILLHNMHFFVFFNRLLWIS